MGNKDNIDNKLNELKDIVVKKLIKNKMSITTMESCTGGALISAITDIEGASRITEGGFVTYSNEQKVKIGVPKEIIDTYGVYSKETAIHMARVCRIKINSEIGVGITGTLSNIDPNNKDSVQGEVYFCINYGGDSKVVKKIKVPIESRDEQKKFIIYEILTELKTIINN
ncbi:MAG: CinA family protein [Clostridium butyricum]|nr:CinA family protein [Clostridium butyricum]